MYHGEDLAKALVSGALGPRSYSEVPAEAPRTAPRAASVPGLIAQASEIGQYAADRAMSVDGLSCRALDLATRLTGSFPAPAGRQANGETADRGVGPDSALSALQQTISNIRGPLSAMDDSFHRLATALDAIDRALS
ncbi:hypothetical protein [Methylobacterium brachiatum]|uniref:hypothetical protein n=1 Tax=Methylobacterium brachiatum TaxID=269660 RepID=UPI0024486950|nr:hypothetical protein [Methylobacterium brachiatum]MDH2313365.1 hypothetical protein [Methylobacterium brachiatum]